MSYSQPQTIEIVGKNYSGTTKQLGQNIKLCLNAQWKIYKLDTNESDKIICNSDQDWYLIYIRDKPKEDRLKYKPIYRDFIAHETICDFTEQYFYTLLRDLPKSMEMELFDIEEEYKSTHFYYGEEVEIFYNDDWMLGKIHRLPNESKDNYYIILDMTTQKKYNLTPDEAFHENVDPKNIRKINKSTSSLISTMLHVPKFKNIEISSTKKGSIYIMSSDKNTLIQHEIIEL